MIQKLAPSAHPAAVLLTCCDCGHSFEPSVADFASGHTGCPDPRCGGWTFRAQLLDPAAVPNEHNEPTGGCLP